MCQIIDLNPCIYLNKTIHGKRQLMQSLIKNPDVELTLGNLYDMALDIQELESKLKSLIKGGSLYESL